MTIKVIEDRYSQNKKKPNQTKQHRLSFLPSILNFILYSKSLQVRTKWIISQFNKFFKNYNDNVIGASQNDILFFVLYSFETYLAKYCAFLSQKLVFFGTV